MTFRVMSDMLRKLQNDAETHSDASGCQAGETALLEVLNVTLLSRGLPSARHCGTLEGIGASSLRAWMAEEARRACSHRVLGLDMERVIHWRT